ncbi:hypothetical protein F2P56_027190 [Juglans regia]|uniref:Myb/SANT-like domain-containing protein n=1 Tax=Juglans regia TaxID=51240 RepID=A0A833UHQ8_JUGRE|nr:hypothetical protein F2P56_027190 [Juglans regia]
MDNTEVLRDHNLLAGGLDEMMIDMLYQEVMEGKLVGSKITNRDIVRLATRLTKLGIKPVDSSQVKGKVTLLKKTQCQFTDLMDQTGMGWNPFMKTVIGSTAVGKVQDLRLSKLRCPLHDFWSVGRHRGDALCLNVGTPF